MIWRERLCDVSETVEQVASELQKSILRFRHGDIRGGAGRLRCKLRLHCWKAGATIPHCGARNDQGGKNGEPEPESAPEEFIGRCMRVSRVANSVYKRYSDYASRIAAEKG
ncbi:MAG: hypothetical protein ACLR56_08880 [Oscillospiraceae bacterium]